MRFGQVQRAMKRPSLKKVSIRTVIWAGIRYARSCLCLEDPLLQKGYQRWVCNNVTAKIDLYDLSMSQTSVRYIKI